MYIHVHIYTLYICVSLHAIIYIGLTYADSGQIYVYLYGRYIYIYIYVHIVLVYEALSADMYMCIHDGRHIYIYMHADSTSVWGLKY